MMLAQDAQCIPFTLKVCGVILFPLELVDLKYFAHSLFRVAALYLLHDARRKMIFQYHILNIRKPLFHRRGLRDDIYAVRILLNHFLQSPYLPFQYLEAADYFFRALAVRMSHMRTSVYPPGGICQRVWKTFGIDVF